MNKTAGSYLYCFIYNCSESSELWKEIEKNIFWRHRKYFLAQNILRKQIVIFRNSTVMVTESWDTPERSIPIPGHMNYSPASRVRATSPSTSTSSLFPRSLPEHRSESDGRAACLFAAPRLSQVAANANLQPTWQRGFDCHMSPQSCLTSNRAVMEYSRQAERPTCWVTGETGVSVPHNALYECGIQKR